MKTHIDKMSIDRALKQKVPRRTDFIYGFRSGSISNIGLVRSEANLENCLTKTISQAVLLSTFQSSTQKPKPTQWIIRHEKDSTKTLPRYHNPILINSKFDSPKSLISFHNFNISYIFDASAFHIPPSLIHRLLFQHFVLLFSKQKHKTKTGIYPPLFSTPSSDPLYRPLNVFPNMITSYQAIRYTFSVWSNSIRHEII